MFVAAYLLLSPLAAWRLAHRRTRLAVLIRPTVVLVLRVVTFILRALEADGKVTSTGVFTAEQILLYLGLIPLCEPLLSLSRFHIRRFWTPSPREGDRKRPSKSLVDRLLKLLELALLAALILGITVRPARTPISHCLAHAHTPKLMHRMVDVPRSGPKPATP